MPGGMSEAQRHVLHGGPAQQLLFPLELRAARLSYLTFFLSVCALAIVVWMVGFLYVWPRTRIRAALSWFGVAFQRVSRTVQELERKTLHLVGVIIPLGYHLCLTYVRGYTQFHATVMATAIASVWLILDVLRVNVPWVRRHFPLSHLAREYEKRHLSGVSYYLMGAWIAVVWFPPKIAMTAILFIIFGDMSAAIFGISFGRVKVYGKKSLEGTMAMFLICTAIGLNMFWDIHMREYPVVVAALVASLSELFEPFGVNDNLTISLFSCLALQFGFYRIATCDPNWSVANLLEPGVVDRLVDT